MQVKSLDVSNYRMLKDFQISDFKALNVFIGPNASGKSTVLEVLDLLLEADVIALSSELPFRATAADPIQIDCGIGFDPGEIEQVLRNFAWSNRRPAPEQPIIKEIEKAFEATELHYRFAGIAPRDGGAQVAKQALASGTTLPSYLSGKLSSAAQILGSSQVAIVPSIGSAIFPMISNKTVYLSVNRRIPATFGVGPPTKGSPEEIGKWVLQARGTKLPILQRYEGFITGILTHVKDILVESRQNDFRLGLSENELPGATPAADWSSGTSHLATFLGAMAAQPTGSIILAEEPESSLHPAALRHLMEEVRGLADAKQLQFFLTTHSDTVLEQLDPATKSHSLWRFGRNADGSASVTRCETEKEVDEAISSLRIR